MVTTETLPDTFWAFFLCAVGRAGSGGSSCSSPSAPVSLLGLTELRTLLSYSFPPCLLLPESPHAFGEHAFLYQPQIQNLLWEEGTCHLPWNLGFGFRANSGHSGQGEPWELFTRNFGIPRSQNLPVGMSVNHDLKVTQRDCEVMCPQ